VTGDRKYKVPVLDPLEIQELKIADAQPRQVGLSLVMRNARVFGMTDSQLEVTRSVLAGPKGYSAVSPCGRMGN
jgi:hypothetical protein